jgi:hypothetical protein
MREFLRLIGHPYADRHKFGDGPNWRLRTIRVALEELDINEAVLRHGIRREVFMCTLSDNALEILKKGKGKPDLSNLRTVEEISDLARTRWMIPRAIRRKDYLDWRRQGIVELIRGSTTLRSERTTNIV